MLDESILICQNPNLQSNLLKILYLWMQFINMSTVII